MLFTERNTQMKDFDVIKLHMCYFIFDFILLWNWEMFFHLCPTFKQWCRCSDTKIIQTIIYDVQMLLLSHTREGHFSVEVLRNWVFSGKKKKKQNSLFASLAFSENVDNVDNQNNLEILWQCHLHIYVSVVSAFFSCLCLSCLHCSFLDISWSYLFLSYCYCIIRTLILQKTGISALYKGRVAWSHSGLFSLAKQLDFMFLGINSLT